MSLLNSIFCPDRSNFFHGNRYVKADDDATRLIFDCDGSLAGMQATVSVDDKLFERTTKNSPTVNFHAGIIPEHP